MHFNNLIQFSSFKQIIRYLFNLTNKELNGSFLFTNILRNTSFFTFSTVPIKNVTVRLEFITAQMFVM